MFDRKVVFSGYGVKVIGAPIGVPISGKPVDDLTDLIDGDGDGKCREENGNFVPCPPKRLILQIRNLRERMAALQGNDIEPSLFNDVTSRIDNAIDLMRRGRHNDANAGHGLSAANDHLVGIERRFGSAPKAPVRPVKRVAAATETSPKGDLSLMERVKERRKAAAEKAKAIAKQVVLPASMKERMRKNNILKFLGDMSNSDYDDNDRYEITEQWLDDIFGGAITDRSGKIFYPEISRIWPRSGRDFSNLTVEGVITDEEGNEVASFKRVLDLINSVVTHDIFVVNDDNRKNGLGSIFVARSEVAYKALGFTRIETTGASATDSGDGGWIGATHWPKMGFDWLDMYAQNKFFDIIDRGIRAYEGGDDDSLFDSKEQVEELKQLMEISKKERPGSANQTLFAGDFLFWPGAQKWFQQRHAQINYVKRLDK